jgi:hypothetical protein
MCVKDGSYAVSMENRCKTAIKLRFFNMNGSSLHSGKLFKWQRNFIMSYFLFLKKMETWPIHIQISMFNGHFTPIFHQNLVGAFLTHIINQSITKFRYKNLIWCSWDNRLLVFLQQNQFLGILKIQISCVSEQRIWVALYALILYKSIKILCFVLFV